MICYVLAMGKQHLGPHVAVGYGIKVFWPGLLITSPDHLVPFERADYLSFRHQRAWNGKTIGSHLKN